MFEEGEFAANVGILVFVSRRESVAAKRLIGPSFTRHSVMHFLVVTRPRQATVFLREKQRII